MEVIDSNEYLEVRCFQQCTKDSPESHKRMRGIICNKEDCEIVPSFGFMDTFTIKESDVLEELLTPIENWRFYKSVEGTLLRCFHYQNQWYLSTHRKLDAFQSRWSCRETFGELFVKEVRRLALSSDTQMMSTATGDINDDHVLMTWFYSILHPETIYYFLLRSNSENRIVCHPAKSISQLLYIGSVPLCKPVSEFFYDDTIPFLSHMEKQEQITTMDGCWTVTSLLERVEQMDPYEYQGILAWEQHTHKQLKLFNSEYCRLYELRDNNPNLRFRFLELRRDETQLAQFYRLYPKYSDVFDDYEESIRQLSRCLHQYYIARYIKNQYITLPKEEYEVVKKAHQWYLQDKKQNSVFSKNILNLLNQETPLSLYKMIKRYHIYQKAVKPSTQLRFHI